MFYSAIKRKVMLSVINSVQVQFYQLPLHGYVVLNILYMYSTVTSQLVNCQRSRFSLEKDYLCITVPPRVHYTYKSTCNKVIVPGSSRTYPDRYQSKITLIMVVGYEIRNPIKTFPKLKSLVLMMKIVQ